MYILNFEFRYTVDDIFFFKLYYASFLSTVWVDFNLILFCLYNYVRFVLAYIGYNRFLFV